MQLPCGHSIFAPRLLLLWDAAARGCLKYLLVLCNSVGGKPAGTGFVLFQVNPVLPFPSYATSVITLRQDIFLFH